MVTFLYPGAAQHPVPYATRPLNGSLGLVLHVQQGNNSLARYMANPANSVLSHFWVAKTGVVEQYKDGGFQSWAQMAGNASYHSVETEGFATEALTPEQITALAGLYEWGHLTFGWPLQLAEIPGQPGFAWHGMGAAAWGGHTGCPGDLRKPQRAAILAAITNQGDDMTPTEMLTALDAAAKSTEAGTPVPGTVFIEAIAHRVVAMIAASKGTP